MNIYTLLMIIPVVLAVALIIMIVRRNITENSGRSIDIAPAIPAVVVLMIAILVIAPMAESTQDYLFDENSGELTIQKNIPQLAVQPWDEYADEVKTLVINDGVSIGTGAFDSLTSLERVVIGEDVELSSQAFAGIFKRPTGASVQPAAGQEYLGFGNGTVYLVDPTVFTFSESYRISGSTADLEAVVIPAMNGTSTITMIGPSAFINKTSIIGVIAQEGCQVATVNSNAFNGCTSMAYFRVPSVHTLGDSALNGCSALEELDLPELTATGGLTLKDCTSLTRVNLPASTGFGGSAFAGCTAIEEVTFGPLEQVSGTTFSSWTFYESDGTTTIDKTVASNLANKSFMGTAAALVEVSAGTLSLTPLQLQQVHLHDTELQDLQNQPISLDPLPFQPSLQTEQEQETA